MTSHTVLTADDHRDLRVRTDSSGAFGDAVMAAYTVPGEFRQLQNEFPIVFRRDAESRLFGAIALLGFEAGENLFLRNDQWNARYKPLALAIQPFLVGRAREGEEQSQVHIDLAHPRISNDGSGVRLFDETGRPTPFLNDVAAKLGALEEGHRTSADFFSALVRYELLEPFALDVTLDSGANHRMVGYHLINEDRLGAIDASALIDLQSSGHLEPIYMALASLANLRKLVDLKNRKLVDG